MNNTILIDLGDIVYAIHDDEMKHPFLVIEVNSTGFKALKTTSVKYDEFKNIILNDFQQKIVDRKAFVQVDSNDGFKFHSLVICDSYYFYKWGKNNYEIKKVGNITNNNKWNEIIKLFNYFMLNNNLLQFNW